MVLFNLIFFVLHAIAMSGDACHKQGGLVVNTLSGRGCVAGKSIGDIEGTNCPCVCCVGEKRAECDKNVVKVDKICDGGTFLKVHLRFKGKTPIQGISFEIKSPNWFGGADLNGVDLKKSNYNIPLEKIHSNKGYNTLSSYTVRFQDVPLEDCRFPQKTEKTIPIASCLQGNH